MNLRDTAHLRSVDPESARVYGEPFETADGTPVIPVNRPVGVFVVKDGKAEWQPAVDATRVALMGILVGLVSATLAGVAMVRRPPWPDLHGEITSLPRRAVSPVRSWLDPGLSSGAVRVR